MKKFFTLFALLSVALSASAQSYSLSIWYETSNLRDDMLPNIHMYNDANAETTWPGPKMNWVENTGTTKVYKWEGNLNFMPTKFIYSYNADQEAAAQTFVNNGYYVDGHLLKVNGDTGYDVYFDNSNTGWNSNNVRLYAWADGNLNLGWPGITMQSIDNNILKFHIGANIYHNILFNDGGNNKTEDFTLTDGMTYTNNVTLVEGQNLQYQSTVTASKAHYERTIAVDEWGTLCLPFPISGSNDYVTFYELNGVSSTALTFAPITASPIPAGTPMLFKRISGEGSNLWIEEKNVEINPNPGQGGIDGFTMHGTFNLLSNQSDVYILYGGEICLGTSGITINPYRAWFTSNSNSQAPFRIEVADTEGLQYVEQEDGTVKAYYDLQGRKLNGARKGLVIENGKIIMVK